MTSQKDTFPLQLFAPELNLSLLLIGSLLDNRDGTGSGVGRRSPRSNRLGVFALAILVKDGVLWESTPEE